MVEALSLLKINGRAAKYDKQDNTVKSYDIYLCNPFSVFSIKILSEEFENSVGVKYVYKKEVSNIFTFYNSIQPMLNQKDKC